ncbi:hypothetical protein VOLCADRAFT_96870 [Volvox carteri f. nagariensis]|uniref:Uncharacterized protein n=1 Tax=Volvox carteri f. nagariensis TaxID=3068 RepID=D8UBI4_VOLCA|nr:uncharacterized protein VOLCADRAFT_96870 [Volvox carteri f. nagariensis]EFJ42893.1 hypothetical protein VOLCADRAFT_96870 [Volvox carteri f. nagariensis]|eukprot:XP_002955933.1 hypothetical protein VOLCADRAFT_96870 [Volvox carteri f. nagariensis]
MCTENGAPRKGAGAVYSTWNSIIPFKKNGLSGTAKGPSQVHMQSTSSSSMKKAAGQINAQMQCRCKSTRSQQMMRTRLQAAAFSSSSATLVGYGRVGKAFAKMLGDDLAATVSRRNGSISLDGKGPIYVCTTNDALDDVLQRTPPARRRDLVLLQNGWLLPWLDRNGLEDVTLVALYMAASPGGTATDGRRTVASGRWGDHVASTLNRGGVSCAVVSRDALYKALVEKALWASIFWMLSCALGGAKVGDIAVHHRLDVKALVDELLPMMRQSLEAAAAKRPGADAAAAALRDHGTVLDALMDYSMSIGQAVPSREMALAEFSWRNGALLEMGLTPLHCSWLQRAGVDITSYVK